MSEHELRSLARSLTEKYFRCDLEIGKTVVHPDGRKVKVTRGQYWGEHGLSNFWYWRPVLKGGKLGPEESGYGWSNKQRRKTA